MAKRYRSPIIKKRCSKCLKDLPEAQFWPRRLKKGWGLDSWCKICKAESTSRNMRAYYRRHREEIIARTLANRRGLRWLGMADVYAEMTRPCAPEIREIGLSERKSLMDIEAAFPGRWISKPVETHTNVALRNTNLAKPLLFR